MRTRLQLAVALLVALARPDASWGATPSAIDVRLARPARADVVRHVTLPGRVKANQEVTLHAKVPGYLKSLNVDKGDPVSAGQPLGEIEAPELVSDLARVRAELSAATIEFDRLNKAQGKAPDLVVPQSLDDARGRLEIARANVERTETLLRYCRLVAPFDGVVTARFVDPGAFVPAPTGGATTGVGAVITIMDFERVRVQVPVPEREAALVQVGQPVMFTVDALIGRTFATRVSRLSYAIDANTQTMLVEADLPNPDRALRPGMFVTARLGVERHDQVLTVPAAALLTEKTTTSVFVVRDDKALKTAVRVGFHEGDRVEIIDGLTGDERVVLLGKTPLADGAPIKPTEAP